MPQPLGHAHSDRGVDLSAKEKPAKTQKQRFIEAARELGVDPDADTEEVMRQIAKQKTARRRKDKDRNQEKGDK